jgi:hypothetical protein
MCIDLFEIIVRAPRCASTYRGPTMARRCEKQDPALAMAMSPEFCRWPHLRLRAEVTTFGTHPDQAPSSTRPKAKRGAC